MTPNTGKCHHVVSSCKKEVMFAKIDATIWQEHGAKLLGILIDSDLLKSYARKHYMLSTIARITDITYHYHYTHCST